MKNKFLEHKVIIYPKLFFIFKFKKNYLFFIFKLYKLFFNSLEAKIGLKKKIQQFRDGKKTFGKVYEHKVKHFQQFKD